MSMHKGTSGRPCPEDTSEDESNSSYSGSGSGTSPVAGLSQISASKRTVGAAHSLRGSLELKQFFSLSNKRPQQEDSETDESNSEEYLLLNAPCVAKMPSNSKACSSLCSRATDKRSIHLDGDNVCCGGLNGVSRVRAVWHLVCRGDEKSPCKNSANPTVYSNSNNLNAIPSASGAGYDVNAGLSIFPTISLFISHRQSAAPSASQHCGHESDAPLPGFP
ncbi:hypothetical protein FN846DRAFT_891476 [Sphaerosporella brunnea]|uniref:Uncharacterized protein n=1 Tax=Sphaerosporella brunnea TaxID=1250544 RepID=A0A5J5ET46_9PEZI|nr:hypothetical protein FN846DRAFT_891476 [Sphaerosporella brunnea]